MHHPWMRAMVTARISSRARPHPPADLPVLHRCRRGERGEVRAGREGPACAADDHLQLVVLVEPPRSETSISCNVWLLNGLSSPAGRGAAHRVHQVTVAMIVSKSAESIAPAWHVHTTDGPWESEVDAHRPRR